MIHALLHTVHRIQDSLGLPVNYSDREFRRFKQGIDWSRVESDRIQSLARVFGMSEQTIAQFAAEAEQIVCEEKECADETWSGVGNPMGRTDRITLYVAVRAARPQLAVETGTAAGASARYILEAMHRNDCGRLISIDLTDRRANIGRLIPSEHRSRIELLAGDSLKILRQIDLAGLDFFLHDSCHKYRHMTAEYEIARENFGARGVICSHDVLMTNAWPHFLRQHRIERHASVKNFGVLRWEQN